MVIRPQRGSDLREDARTHPDGSGFRLNSIVRIAMDHTGKWAELRVGATAPMELECGFDRFRGVILFLA